MSVTQNARMVTVAVALAWAATVAVSALPQSRPPSADASFEQMLDRVDKAQLELQNGRPEPFKALWSHADDITLSGGLGGEIERGWQAVSRRLDWVATQFSSATHQRERVTAYASGSLGYVVQREHIRFHVPGQAAESTREYRVTMVFRKETGAWRMVHRQADSQFTRTAGQ